MKRLYRLPMPAPRECACGCAVFVPRQENQLYRTPACRVAVANFKARRRRLYNANRP
jgi:hypothetical protein